MDTATIDQQYNQLQTEFQDVAKSVEDFAQKLQTAAQGGDQNAREWLLDLKQIALDVKDEQVQVGALLQAIHGWAADAAQNAPAPAQQPAQPQAGGFGMGGRGGMFGGLLGGGFGRAMEMGAGIGLGEDMINSIFR
ncbi:MAG TPA: hypothetical protein VMF09_12140 [Solirubrobacteraceae bacterium]|nr:hypothetical protein [Solirubrobacteraceae bacterium]